MFSGRRNGGAGEIKREIPGVTTEIEEVSSVSGMEGHTDTRCVFPSASVYRCAFPVLRILCTSREFEKRLKNRPAFSPKRGANRLFLPRVIKNLKYFSVCKSDRV